MLGQASENHRKITVVKKQKKINSGYPKSDGVHSESTRKSSGSVKTSYIYSLYIYVEHAYILPEIYLQDTM